MADTTQIKRDLAWNVYAERKGLTTNSLGYAQQREAFEAGWDARGRADVMPTAP